jgi:hypothetical protein
MQQYFLDHTWCIAYLYLTCRQKCASCADDPLKQKHGSKIQCTKGKCVKAYHVTCALADPMVEFKEMEVDEWVTVPTSSMTTSAPNESSAIGSDVVNTIQGDKLLDPSAPPLISATSPLEEKTTQGQRFERVTVVHAYCLCPHHNPVSIGSIGSVRLAQCSTTYPGCGGTTKKGLQAIYHLLAPIPSLRFPGLLETDYRDLGVILAELQ